MGQIDWGKWLPIILAGIQAFYQALSYYRENQTMQAKPAQSAQLHGTPLVNRRYAVMGILMLLTWGAVAFDYCDRRQYGALVNVMTAWGGVAYRPSGEPYRGLVRVDGRRLLSFQRDYRVAVVGYPYDGKIELQGNLLINILDVMNMQKSEPYEIRNEEMDIIFSFDDKFIEEWKRRRKGTWYTLFLVPRNVEMEHFSTMRQALAFGLMPLQTSHGQP